MSLFCSNVPSSPLKFYALDISNYCSSVKIALIHKNIPHCEFPPPDGYGSVEYKKIVEMGTIPAIVVDDDEFGDSRLVLSESQVILEYLEERYPEPNPLLFVKDDPKYNANIRLIHRVHDLYLEPALRSLFPHMDPAVRNQAFVHEKIAIFNKRLKYIDSLCSLEEPYICGEKFTLCDCVLPPTLLLELIPGGINLDEFPRIQSWWSHIRLHESVAPVLERAAKATHAWVERKRGGAVSTCTLSPPIVSSPPQQPQPAAPLLPPPPPALSNRP